MTNTTTMKKTSNNELNMRKLNIEELNNEELLDVVGGQDTDMGEEDNAVAEAIAIFSSACATLSVDVGFNR